MKWHNFSFCIWFVMIGSVGCYSGKTIKTTIQYNGVARVVTVYVPKKINGTSPVPLLLNLHGYSSNADEQMWYGDFRKIADTANFIIAHPQGLKYHDTTHWNTGGWTPGSTVDDLGFLDQVIVAMNTQYKIDPKRIYAAGMSNGGEMSYHLACRLTHKLAAIASVSGAMTPETFQDCRPSRAIPILHLHGTADSVVPYAGDATAISILRGLQYWVKKNGCDSVPIIIHLPNKNNSDSSTVDHLLFRGVAPVEHFKIIGGQHTWAGSTFKFAGTNYDINASNEIWKFFNRYDMDGLRKVSSVD